MTKQIIEKFLDKAGVTPGPWFTRDFSPTPKWPDDERQEIGFGNDGELISECVPVKADAHVLAASREMLVTLIDITYSQNMYYSHMFLESISNKFFKKEHANQIEVIESALPGYTWEGIKEELERMKDEETTV
jgi:hypothetical protein